MLMYDRIVNGEGIYQSIYEKKQIELPDMKIIKIDNVARYYFDNIQEMGWISFPNIAPVFDEFWMEFNVPQNIYRKYNFLGNRMGFLFFGRKLNKKQITEAKNIFGHKDVGFDLVSYIFVEINKKIVCYGKVGQLINKNGLPIVDGKTHVLMTTEYWDSVTENAPSQDSINKGAGLLISPAYLALSFMHCKNVTIKAERPPDLLARKHYKKKRATMHKYYTLNIEPMKKVLKYEGEAGKNGLKKALHICRGHFKDYRDGKGLFGKYRDIYWWESHVRGNAEYGTIHKDYNILTPEETG